MTDLAPRRLHALSTPTIVAMTAPPLALAAGSVGAMVTGPVQQPERRARLSHQRRHDGNRAHPRTSSVHRWYHYWRPDEHIDLSGHGAPIVAYSGTHLAGDET
jgi:hypothetical protein